MTEYKRECDRKIERKKEGRRRARGNACICCLDWHAHIVAQKPAGFPCGGAAETSVRITEM